MKLLITSDVHGEVEKLEAVIKKNKDCEHILCAGDIGLTNVQIEDNNLIAVKGNCDYYSNLPLDRILDLGGKKILLTHGHVEQVKYGLEGLFQKAEHLGIDIVVFGHIHYPVLKTINNILFINPGALNDVKGNYAIYEDGVVTFCELG